MADVPWGTFLSAELEGDVDAAFDLIFEVIHGARVTGDVSQCESLLEWIAREGVTESLHVDILLSPMRLTATMRHALTQWRPALHRVESELDRRGADAHVLLAGLLEPS